MMTGLEALGCRQSSPSLSFYSFLLSISVMDPAFPPPPSFPTDNLWEEKKGMTILILFISLLPGAPVRLPFSRSIERCGCMQSIKEASPYLLFFSFETVGCLPCSPCVRGRHKRYNWMNSAAPPPPPFPPSFGFVKNCIPYPLFFFFFFPFFLSFYPQR